MESEGDIYSAVAVNLSEQVDIRLLRFEALIRLQLPMLEAI